jgi:hypothetical protein
MKLEFDMALFLSPLLKMRMPRSNVTSGRQKKCTKRYVSAGVVGHPGPGERNT